MGALEDDADSCSAVEHGMGMRESAVHIPRDMHEDGMAAEDVIQFLTFLPPSLPLPPSLSLPPPQILLCCVLFSGQIR